jgi:hypothetical protein
MMVYTKTPRVRTFRAFTSAKQAASFVKGLDKRYISARIAHNRIIVNYFAR